MEYGKILNRSANLVWENKFLIIIGIIAALGGGGSTSNFNFNSGGSGTGPPFGEPGQFPQIEDEIAGLAIGILITIICVVVVIGLILWAISTIARGGLIAGVDSIESGEKTNLSGALRAGWQKVWTLLGIGFIPAIPGFILLVVSMLGLVAFGGFRAVFGEEISTSIGGAELVLIGGLLCILIPIALALGVLRNFAERAAMIENLGVIDSYKRGWNVLSSNLGEAIVLFLIQVGIGIILGIALFLPGIIAAICCFLWPLLLLVQGAINAVISTLWTLAWRTWTGKDLMLIEKEPTAI